MEKETNEKKVEEEDFVVTQKDGSTKSIKEYGTVEVHEFLSHIKQEIENLTAFLNPITCPEKDTDKQKELRDYLEMLGGAKIVLEAEFESREDKHLI